MNGIAEMNFRCLALKETGEIEDQQAAPLFETSWELEALELSMEYLAEVAVEQLESWVHANESQPREEQGAAQPQKIHP